MFFMVAGEMEYVLLLCYQVHLLFSLNLSINITPSHGTVCFFLLNLTIYILQPVIQNTAVHSFQ
jgi:hypothetical protein